MHDDSPPCDDCRLCLVLNCPLWGADIYPAFCNGWLYIANKVDNPHVLPPVLLPQLCNPYQGGCHSEIRAELHHDHESYCLLFFAITGFLPILGLSLWCRLTTLIISSPLTIPSPEIYFEIQEIGQNYTCLMGDSMVCKSLRSHFLGWTAC